MSNYGRGDTATTYPKDSPCPSDSYFTKQSKSLPSGNPSRTSYPGDSTTPFGGHHTGTDKVRVSQAEGGSGGPSKDSYPRSPHALFKNEKRGS